MLATGIGTARIGNRHGGKNGSVDEVLNWEWVGMGMEMIPRKWKRTEIMSHSRIPVDILCEADYRSVRRFVCLSVSVCDKVITKVDYF